LSCGIRKFHGVAEDLLEVKCICSKDLGVHEIVVLAVVVQVLHLVLVELRFFDFIFRAETMLHHGAGAEIPHFHLDESAQVARGAMFHLEDRVQLFVELDHHARTQLCCRKHKRKFQCNRRGREGPPVIIMYGP
jgi:hypothetical protein